jgi:hypothetical protein
VVVGCLSCATENVLGLDLRVPARRAVTQEKSVMGALRHRLRARLRLGATVVVAAACVFWLGRELVWTARIPKLRPSGHYCYGCKVQVIDNSGRATRVTVTQGGVTRQAYIPGGAKAAVDCKGDCRVEQRKMWP